MSTQRPGSLSLFAALILIATAAVAADGIRGLDTLLDFLQTDTVVAEPTEMTLTEINNTTTTLIECPFKNTDCCVQNNPNATEACVSSVCAIVTPGQDFKCANLVEALLAMYASKPGSKGGTQTTNVSISDPTTEPTDVPTATGPTNTSDTYSPTPAPDVYRLACENEYFQIACGADQRIQVNGASFGRTELNTERCDEGDRELCPTFDVTAKLQNLCDDKKNCASLVSANVFENDPCPHTTKYLNFTYKCLQNV